MAEINYLCIDKCTKTKYSKVHFNKKTFKKET